MTKMKKIFSVLLALAMVLGMSVTAFGAQTGTPDVSGGEGSPKATIQGIEDESGATITVEAYRIIKYNEAGYYEEVLEGTIDKTPVTNGQPTLNPSAENVQELYYNRLGDLKALNDKADFTKQADGTYTCDNLGLGTWLVVVSGAAEYMYNPAIISVNKTPDGTEYGTLNLNTNTWNETEQTYLKKDHPTITKTAESAMDPEDTNVVGTQFGDILKFTVTADIPAYTAEKKDIVYKISDTLTGLDFVLDDTHDVSVKVGKDAASAAANDAAKTIVKDAIQKAIDEEAKAFTAEGFGDDFLIQNSGSKIIIEYYAKVTSTTMINVDRLNNTAELEYSNNSDSTDDTNKTETETKHYTFGIDTTVEGWKGSESSNPTGEFVKINDQGGIEYTETPGEVTKEETTEFLDGAEFQLHIGTKDGALFTDKSGKSTFVTDDNGRLEIAGLDDGVEYWLIETKAPAGYSLNQTPIRVYINATYEMDEKTGLQDVLTGYEVQMGEGVTHYKYDVTTGETEFINTADAPSNPFGFKNTKLTNLPSTGGIGTTIFTIGGCLIMLIAAGLFFASRRKSAK